jgi:hypothetical protein
MNINKFAGWLNIRMWSVRWNYVLMAAVFVFGSNAIALAEAAGKGGQDTEDKFQQDRKAILAMAGNYHVNFSFRETVSFIEDYELKEPYKSKGHETIRVIRDDGDFISLQHILVVEGIFDDQMPIKHWRQDWIYQPKRVFEYMGNNIWRTRSVDEKERQGKWAQLVYQVDDSPRYAAVAEWTHQYGVSFWNSPPTWRPLPRRERTKRDDYDVLVSVNRHALTPDGWVHEQENSKLILRNELQVVAREIGVNTYTVSEAFKSQVAEEYWKETKEFWAEIRDEWRRLHDEIGTFGVKPSSPSGKIYNQILILAKEAREGNLELETAVARARNLIRDSTTTNVAKFTSPGSHEG